MWIESKECCFDYGGLIKERKGVRRAGLRPISLEAESGVGSYTADPEGHHVSCNPIATSYES